MGKDDEEKGILEPEEKEEEDKSPRKNIILGILAIIFIPFKLLFGLITKNRKTFVVFLLILFAIGATIYLARTKPELLGIPTNQSIVESQKEVNDLVNKVGKIMKLPANETPTVATVSDVEKVKGQNFFANAQNGDKVLIYTNAKKAILYRPSEGKIIEVGFVNINNEGTTQGTNVISPTISVKPQPTNTPTPTPIPTGKPSSTPTPEP